MAQSAMHKTQLPAIPAQPTAADQSLPAIPAGFRLVPVRVKNGNVSTIAYLPCPTWCDEDHVAEPVGAIEDVMHRSDVASVYVPTFGYGAYPVQMHAWIEGDPVATDPAFRAPHIAVGDASGDEGAHVTPEMAEKLADDLIGFASELRHLARIARQANVSERSARGAA
ncbi:hypothetical protein HZZ00_34935 [Streptomyces sp. NEAU-sy36]|uniref:DUF6907 domain-containing protein n=1 Tax=unclassified Streptomyces TaxID=2593676 RepID=UPI0015D58A69|nr:MULTISPECIES: hypothetical protein [unclassified Streptomyces]QLJ05707.1 hypothetical protein HZZ00_34935 [Streptomyces sp. NEAU-sy36]